MIEKLCEGCERYYACEALNDDTRCLNEEELFKKLEDEEYERFLTEDQEYYDNFDAFDREIDLSPEESIERDKFREEHKFDGNANSNKFDEFGCAW